MCKEDFFIQNKKTFILVEGALMIALATALSYVRVFQLPVGGSITLFSMVPIVIFSIRHGVKSGLLVSFTYSLLQFMQGVIDGLFGWGLTPGMLIACILMDYILAFTVLGLAGMFRKGIKGNEVLGWITGIAIAVTLRFLCHYLSGVIIWKSVGELWEGFTTDNPLLYSLIYNGAYMLPEMILTMIGAALIIKAPALLPFLKNRDSKN